MAGKSIDKGIQERKIRVLLCVSEIDGHDRGLKYIAKKLAEAGMEVVYISYKIIEEIVDTAIQEDVDAIGISSSTGGHLGVISDLMELLKAKGVDNKLVIAGGIIPTVDIPILQEMGVGRVFGPGTHSHEVVRYILENVDKKNDPMIRL
jgi:methylmalonyl-CoA mutase C-terminal domain/subunit